MLSWEDYLEENLVLDVIESNIVINAITFSPGIILREIARDHFHFLCFEFGVDEELNNLDLKDQFDELVEISIVGLGFEISGIHITAIDILNTLYPDYLEWLRASYQECKLEILEQEKERVDSLRKEAAFHSLKYQLPDYFPTPVSFSFHKFLHGTFNESEKYYYLRDCWESLIFLLYSIVVSEYLHNKVWGAFKNIRTKDLFDFSISKKLDIISEILSFQNASTSHFLSNEIISSFEIQKLKDLNNDRNFVSHSQTQSREELKKKNKENSKKLLEVLSELEVLKSLKYSIYQGTYKTEANKLLFDEFVGHSWNKKIIKKQFKKKKALMLMNNLNREKVFVRLKQRAIEVSPFISFINREGYDEHRLAYLKSNEKGIMTYEIVGASGENALIKIDESKYPIINSLRKKKSKL